MPRQCTNPQDFFCSVIFFLRLMAVRQINNKSDDIYDNLLPDSALETIIFDARGTYNLGIKFGYDMLNIDNGTGIHAAIGPHVARATSSKITLFQPFQFSLIIYCRCSSTTLREW